jgi:D-arabinose 1-dehydrogenase-like Zn-dependent alcohol dehydrogenase
MSGIINSDGGFAEYMVASHYALVHLPDNLSFEQAAPLMCAGVSYEHFIAGPTYC